MAFARDWLLSPRKSNVLDLDDFKINGRVRDGLAAPQSIHDFEQILSISTWADCPFFSNGPRWMVPLGSRTRKQNVRRSPAE